VEEAMFQQLPQGTLHPYVNQYGWHQYPSRFSSINLGKLGALDPLHGQHPTGGEVPGRCEAHKYPRCARKVLQTAGHFPLRGCSPSPQRSGPKLIHNGDQVATNAGNIIGRELSQLPQNKQIQSNTLSQTGALHLHGHGFAGFEATFVDLPQGSGSHRVGG
jgi:hypothetical protein